MGKRTFSSVVTRLLLLAVLFAVGVGGWLYARYQKFADAPLAISDETVLSIERGDGFNDVLAKLRAVGIEQGEDLEWKALALEMDVVSRLQVGDYTLDHGMTPRELLRKLESGDVIHYRFTIIEGWNVRDLRAALARDSQLQQALAAKSDAELMAALGRPGLHPEGRFLPETYHYTRGMSDLDVLKRALLAMDQALLEAWDGRVKGLPLQSPDEMLALASIVEKETGKASERSQIAGVFVRRLNLGMKLQTDPTVIYGLGSAFDGNLRRRDLETDTPYNTYTRVGLPPTPIAMPGRDALRAVARPADGDALYFVAKGDGSHQFSASLDEHNAAVRRYQLGGR